MAFITIYNSAIVHILPVRAKKEGEIQWREIGRGKREKREKWRIFRYRLP